MTNIRALTAAFLFLFSVAANAQEMKKTDLKTANDKLNYAVGYDVGRTAKRNKMTIEKEIFLQGVLDGEADDDNLRSALLTASERVAVKKAHSMFRREIEREERLAKAGENIKQSTEFMKKNKRKKGVITTSSGLQYRVIKQGTGPKPTLEDTVTVHYKGTLVDGTEFDSSYMRERPATFGVKRVVKGWTEALQLMPVGSKWILYIPPELGYGERGAGGKIGPNSVMIFEIELLEIQAAEKSNDRDNYYTENGAAKTVRRVNEIVPAGVYKGVGYQNNGTSWSIEITVGDESSTIRYPSLFCGGTLSVKSVQDTRVEFYEDITYGDNCVDNGITALSVTDTENTFFYYWLYTDGVAGAVGTVRRD